MVVATGCGVIVAYEKCKHGERIAPIVNTLSKTFKGFDKPDTVIYDRACFARAHLHNEARASELAEALGGMDCLREWREVNWVVDRFHFSGHSEADMHCR